MTRIGTLTVTMGTVLALVLAACAPPTSEDADDGGDDIEEGEDQTDGEDDDGGQEQSEEASGGTLRIARTGAIGNLDPHVATAFQSIQALEMIYETLFEHDEDLNVIGGLAEDWEYSDDGQTLTVSLAQDVTFHDGSALTSDDVAASIERVLDEDTGAAARANITSIESVETPDETTVEFELSRPDATLPAAMTSTNLAIVPSGSIEEGTLDSEPVGSGAFEFEDWDEGNVFRVAAYEDYWRGAPALDGVEVRVVPDESSVAAGLTAGEYELGVVTDPFVVADIDEDELDVQRQPALAYRVLQLNTEVEPFDDERVRQAMACAVDRQELVESALLGEGEPTGPFTAPAFDFEPTAGLPCDPPDLDQAEELLAEAGYEDGFDFEMIVMTGGYETATNEAQSLQSQLGDIGIEAEIEELESSVYVDRWLETDYEGAVALNGGNPDPHLMYARYFTSDGNFQSVATYSTDELDELFAEGEAETDPDARREIYKEISERLVEAAPWIWTANSFEYRVLRPEVEGFESLPTGSMVGLRDTSLSE